MEIDIRTIILILGVTHLMQVLVFFHQYKVNKAYKGIGWWLMWSAAEVIGFIFILLRGIPALLNTAIIVQNVAILAGTIFIYIGVMRFFGKKENLKFIILFFGGYILSLLYLLFIDDNVQLRSVITSIAYVFISFLTAYSLYKNKTPSISATANFNIIIFIVHGGIFLYRTIMIFSGASVSDIFTPSLFNFLPYFDALIVSLLWTFGFVIMVNQRLNSEMTEAKTHFEQIFSTSPDAAIITRLSDGMFVDCNEGYTRISGYTKEDMAGKTSLEINIWKNSEGRKEVVRRMKENGFCENYESIFLKKDGTEITGLMSAKSISLQGVPHIISITRDITERKQIQNKIKNSENKFRSLFENMAEGVALHEVIYDENENPIDYRIVDINKAYENNTGLIAKEVRGKLSREVYKTDIPPYLKEYADVTKSGKPYFFETYFPPLQRHFNISVISPAKGQFATVFLDVTEQRNAEKEKHLFSNVLEQSLNEIYIFDVHTLKFVTVNKGAIENIGYTIEELIQMTPLDLKPQYTLAMFKEIIRPLVENTSELITFNTNHRRKNNTTYPVEVHLSINHKENLFVAIILDITERKQAEELRQEIQNRLVEAQTVAHLGSWEWDIVRDEIRGSEEFYSLFDVQPEEIFRFAQFTGRLHPDDIDNVNREVSDAIKQNLPYDTDYRVKQSDGSWRYLNAKGKVIKDADGNPIRMVGTCLDFTERKQVEEALMRSEKELKKAQEITHIGSWYLNVETNQVVWSEELYKMYGFDPALPPPPYTEHMKLFTPESWESLTTSLAHTRETGIPYELELKTVREGDSNGWMWVRGETVQDKEGKTIALWGAAQDITERKQAEENLSSSEERFRRAVVDSPYPILLHAEDGAILQASNSWCEITGYTRDELATIADWTERAYGERRSLVQEDIDKLYGLKHRVAEGDYTVRTKSGESRIWEFSSAPLGKLKDGRRTVMSMAIDVTERRKAEERLRESEERFRVTFDKSPVGTALVGIDKRFIKCNSAFLNFIGYSENELLEKSISDITYPEDIEIGMKELKQLIEGRIESAKLQKRYSRKDGEIIWGEVSISLVRDGNNKPLFFLPIIQDITDKKKIEEEIRNLNIELEQRVIERTAQLAKSENLLAETGRLARVGGWEIDLVLNKLYWTDTVYLIHEVDTDIEPTVEEAINFYAPEAIPIISEALRLAIEENKPFDEELQLITAKGNRLWVRAIGQAYFEKGKVVKIGGIFQDINERKLAEQERERLIQNLNNKSTLLESANKELEAFSYSVSHDLRAPLRGIDGFSLALYEDYNKNLDDVAKDYIKRIRAGTQKMDGLIDSLLTLSRVSRFILKPEQVNLSLIAKAISRTFKESDKTRNTEFIIQENIIAMCDAKLIQVVLENLLSNAWKFTSKKDKAVINFGAIKEKAKTVYYVKDNGAGFDMKYSGKLFGPFQRLHTEKDYPGTGIGLATVQRIIRRHNGEIRAESKVNEGATFYFTL